MDLRSNSNGKNPGHRSRHYQLGSCGYEVGEAEVVENAEGNRITPSVVAVNVRSGERYVGQIAKRQAVTNPENTIFSVKRLMGRRFEDPDVQNAAKRLPYKIVAGENGDAHVEMSGQSYAPPQISSMVLQKIRQDAEAKLGRDHYPGRDYGSRLFQ